MVEAPLPSILAHQRRVDCCKPFSIFSESPLLSGFIYHLFILFLLCLLHIVYNLYNTLFPGGSESDSHCDAGYILFGDYCYHFESESVKKWQDAENMCKTQNGHLASFESQEELSFLTGELFNLMLVQLKVNSRNI